MKKRRIYKYPNGATLIYQNDKRLNYSAVIAGFLCGSIKNEQNGVAHFVEHMMFKKTKNLTLHEINKERSLITSLNAYTNTNLIMVDFSQSNRLFDKAMNLTSDILLNSVYDNELIDNERRVISEEYKRAIDNLNQEIEHQFAKHFTNALTQEQRLGTDDDLVKITASTLINYTNKNFCTENFILSYCGNFPFRTIKKYTKKYFISNIQTNELLKNDFFPIKITNPPTLVIHHNENNQVKVIIGFKYEFNEEDKKQSILDTLLANNFNYGINQLYNRLRNEGLVYSSSSFIPIFDDKDAMFCFRFATSQDKIQRCLEVAKESINTLINNEIPDDDFENSKNSEIYAYDEMHSSKKYNRAKFNLNYFLDHGTLKKPIKSKKSIKIIKKIKKQELQDYAKTIFNASKHPYVVIMGNVKKEQLPTYETILSIFNS